jgi:hypothetical protein
MVFSIMDCGMVVFGTMEYLMVLGDKIKLEINI